jgi:hypothetical protein
MEVDLANMLFGWLLQIDLACIVCNWDPATGTYVPAAGTVGATAAAAGGLYGAGPWPSNPYPGDTPPLGDPVNPDNRQQVPPGSPPSIPSGYQDRNDLDGRVAAEEAERQRARDSRHVRHPEDSTAPPSGPSTAERVDNTLGDAVYTSYFKLGKR